MDAMDPAGNGVDFEKFSAWYGSDSDGQVFNGRILVSY